MLRLISSHWIFLYTAIGSLFCSSLPHKEAKASTLMDLELADYQRSMRSLEGELSSREDQLQEARRASKTQLEAAQQLRKELGGR